MDPELYIEEFAVEVAVTVTFRPASGVLAGAVYVVAAPFWVVVGANEPQGDGEHDQVTVALAGPPTTWALKAAVVPGSIALVLDETEIRYGGTVTLAWADEL